MSMIDIDTIICSFSDCFGRSVTETYKYNGTEHITVLEVNDKTKQEIYEKELGETNENI